VYRKERQFFGKYRWAQYMGVFSTSCGCGTLMKVDQLTAAE